MPEAGTLDLGLADFGLDDADDIFGDAVLEGKDVGEGAIVALGPELRATGRVEQLRRDAEAVAHAPYAALKRVPDAEFGRRRAGVATSVAQRKGRAARGDGEAFEAGQRRD